MNFSKFLITASVAVSLLGANAASAQNGPEFTSLPELCVEWNSNFGMLNINEYVNAVPSARSLELTLFNAGGILQSLTNASVIASAQRDILVHERTGFAPNAFGQTCTEVPNGDPGDIDGQAIYYHPDGAGVDFAFALPFSRGITGAQFVPFNTFDPGVSANFVANWVSVTNLSPVAGSGTLRYYAQDGSLLGSEAVSLDAGARRDFAAHQFGANRVGLVAWITPAAPRSFSLRNIRYYYDNPTAAPTFNSALQVEGSFGTDGVQAVVQLDKRGGSAVLELSNITNAPISVQATFRSLSGAIVNSRTVSLAAFASFHIVADDILPTALGSVTLSSSNPNSFVAVGVHYSRDEAQQLLNAYALSARVPSGGILTSSYNTFLGQSCDLVLVNTTGSAMMSDVRLTRSDGSIAANSVMISTPANGVSNTDLCANDTANNYGSVRVTPATTGSIVGAVVRHGASDRYQIATAIRQSVPSANVEVSGSPLTLETSGASGNLTVTNNSPVLTVTDITSDFTGTALDGFVTETGNTCASLAPQQSCTLTFTPANTVVPATYFTITGDNAAVTYAQIEIQPGVTVTAVNASSGSASGGTGVTITGTNLTGATGVLFDGVAATSVNVVNSTTVTAVTPAHAAGVVDVTVVTPSINSTLTNGYTYVATAVGQSTFGGVIGCLNGGAADLIAATADNSTGVVWGDLSTDTNAFSATDGAANTTLIVTALGANMGTPYSAQICSDYEVDSQGNTPCQAGNTCYNDWFLPAGQNATASGQLNCLYSNRLAIGGFTTNTYASSTEFSTILSASQSFLMGVESSLLKSTFTRVRCVRAFVP